MKVLVTGSDGYIGFPLVSLLLARGYEVTALDTGFYNEGWLYGPWDKRQMTTVRADTRHIPMDFLRGHDAVIHLAELSNDPLGELNPLVTLHINYKGSIELAEKCKAAGVSRFLHSSSCSVYGIGTEDIKTEQSTPHPQTEYARCKVLVEQSVAKLANESFSPIFLRNATAFGISPRMRFDIVANNLAGLAWTTGEIRLHGDGSPWRPLVHVTDICRAFIAVLDAPCSIVHNQVFNVGSDEANYQVKDIAQAVSQVFPNCEVRLGPARGDNRSYRVSFDKISRTLPSFGCQVSLLEGLAELRELFAEIDMSANVFNATPYTRLQHIRHLLEVGRLDSELIWR